MNLYEFICFTLTPETGTPLKFVLCDRVVNIHACGHVPDSGGNISHAKGYPPWSVRALETVGMSTVFMGGT